MMSNHQGILDALRKSRMPLVIYGAGVVGEVLFKICESLGLAVDGFCDGSPAVAHTTFCNRCVMHTSELPAQYREAVFLISVASIKDVVEKLQELGYDTWFPAGPLLKEYYTAKPVRSSMLSYTDFAVETCIWCHDAFLADEGLYIRSVDVMITERCSLRCKDCSNLMQYYTQPRDCDEQDLKASIDRLCHLVDDILECRVIGGDAFMYKRWPSIVSYLLPQEKIRRVVVYTNGTLLPSKSQLECLKHPKALVVISDYGPLSKKLQPLTETLKNMHIPYRVLDISSWLDCARIYPHHRTDEENKRLFADCCAKNMLTLSNGRLFRCPFSANAFRLEAVPQSASDYVDLWPNSNVSEDDRMLRRKIRAYLNTIPFLQTCDFCNGRPLAGPSVTPAVQTRRPLPYQKYPHKILSHPDGLREDNP
ncbi:hypothetical protein [Desulfosoma sp.]